MKKYISVVLAVLMLVSSFAGVGVYAETTTEQKCKIYYYDNSKTYKILAEVDYGESFSKTIEGSDGWFLLSCIMSDGTAIKPEIIGERQQTIDIEKVTGDVYIHRYTDSKIAALVSARGTALIVRNLQHVTTDANDVDENGNSYVRYSENYYGYHEKFTPEEGYEITGIRAYRTYSYITNDCNYGGDYTHRQGYNNSELSLSKNSDGSYSLSTFPNGGYFIEIIAEPIDNEAEMCSVNRYNNNYTYISNSLCAVKKGSSYTNTITSKFGENTGDMQVTCFMSDGTVIRPEIINPYTQQITIPEVTGDIYISAYADENVSRPVVGSRGTAIIKRNLKNVTTDKNTDENGCTSFFCGTYLYAETFTPEEGYKIKDIKVKGTMSSCLYDVDSGKYLESYNDFEIKEGEMYGTDTIIRNEDGSYTFKAVPVNSYYIEVIAEPDETATTSTTVPETTSSASEKHLYGDVNSDGVINVADVTYIQKGINHIAELDAVQEKAADVTADGIVNIQDATVIQKYTVKFISQFPSGESFDGSET